MMKLLLKRTNAAFYVALMVLSTGAEAKWSISKHVDASSAHLVSSVEKTQSHFVQIFSSINATKAEGMKNTLKIQGYPAFVKIRKQQTQPYYQVQVGPFSSRHLASTAKKSIIELYPQFPFLNNAILKMSYRN